MNRLKEILKRLFNKENDFPAHELIVGPEFKRIIDEFAKDNKEVSETLEISVSDEISVAEKIS